MERRRSFLMKCFAMPFVLAGSFAAMPGKSEPLQNISLLNSKRNIKNVVVLWYSQSGHTERNARLIASVLEKKELNVTATAIKEFDPRSITQYDLIVVGSPVFYYNTPQFVREWIRALPPLDRAPVAAFVTFGEPEGDQYNAACTILELFSQKGGVPVGLRTFMNMSTFPLSWSNYSVSKNILDNRHLPNEKTYSDVRSYAESIIEQVKMGYPIPVEKRVTLRRLSTFLDPIWWTKRLIEEHTIDMKKCTQCGICIKKCPVDAIFPKVGQVDTQRCVLCFGCLNSCPVQAVIIEYKGRRLFGFKELLKRKNITIKEPREFTKPPVPENAVNPKIRYFDGDMC